MVVWFALLSFAHASPMTVHQSSGSEAITVIEKWLAAHPEGLDLSIDSGALDVFIGSCIENPHYWAVRGGEEEVYISFGPEVHEDFGLESLQQNLRYVNIHHKIQLAEGWLGGINHYTPFRVENGGVTVEDYADGRVTLKITQPAVELSAINMKDSPCLAEGANRLPKSCYGMVYDMQIPTSIVINLPIPVPGEGCDDGKPSGL